MSAHPEQPLIIVILTALIGGVWIGTQFPTFVTAYPNISLYLLIGIFFLSSLTIDMRAVIHALRDARTVIPAVVFTLILLPFLAYVVTAPFAPALAISFLLLTAMPAGMTAPLLSELAGGEKHTALVITITSSLLAPFTVPFMVSVMAGHVVHVDGMAMFLRLVQAIILPFFVAQGIRIYALRGISSVSRFFTPFSTILLGGLIAFIVAKRPDEIVSLVTRGESLPELLAICALFISVHIVAYIVFFKKALPDRIALTVCMAYVNFTLAVDLADKFFGTRPDIVLPVVLSVIPWALLFIPFRVFTHRARATQIRR
ncbi:MAG: hypothetical protein HGB03_03880 [Candidatus Yonathbacteria bacterium]|nr:hypothetical protein [Candidatus Yonathbacteria bacterium]NTW47629.1 hypothetical protein [Candidatus Yonathbacteria bacterium]